MTSALTNSRFALGSLYNEEKGSGSAVEMSPPNRHQDGRLKPKAEESWVRGRGLSEACLLILEVG
jgi:hypothetical protein